MLLDNREWEQPPATSDVVIDTVSWPHFLLGGKMDVNRSAMQRA